MNKKKWYLSKIPKIAHFYWGNEELPYLRYLSILSFHRYNPDWKIRFYYPKYRQVKRTWKSKEHKYRTIVKKDYFKELRKLPVTFVEIDFKSLDLSNDLSEVFKSDYLRWFLLSTVGGLWSDMDIIYIDAMNNLDINLEENLYMDTVVCYDLIREHSVGFMAGSIDNVYYKSIWEQATKYKGDFDIYQAIGARLMNRFPKSPEELQDNFPNLKIGNVSTETVYPYNSTMIHMLHASKLNLISKNTIGLHWYAGNLNAGEFVNKITEKNYNNINNVVAKIVDISLNNKKEETLENINSFNFNKPPEKRTLTVQSVVKNEAFIYYSIKSIYPYADKILLYDTGSNDRHTLEDIKKLLEEDTEHKITFKQIPLDFDEEKWSLANLKTFMKEHKGEMSVGKVRQIQIEDTDTEFFMLVDGDEVHYKSTMEKIVNEILPKLNDDIVGVNIPLTWFCDMRHIFAVNCTGRIWRTDKVIMNNESPNEAHCYKSTGVTVKGQDKQYLIYKDIQPYAHFETFLKPWRRTPTRRILFKGKLPEVMERNPYYIKRYLNEKEGIFEEKIEVEPVEKIDVEQFKTSIIIPCFKRSELLNWGLMSLSKQKCKYPFEVIVLNDGIPDETEKVCEQYSDKLNIKYIFTGKRNLKDGLIWRCPGYCLNIGVKQAESDFIILSGAEIVHLDEFTVEKTIYNLIHDKHALVKPQGKDDTRGQYLEYIKEVNGNIDINYKFKRPLEKLCTKLPFFLGLHKKDFIAIGGYDEDFVGWAYDDTDLVGRLSRYGHQYLDIDSQIIHLYHPRKRVGIFDIRSQYRHNKKLYQWKERNKIIYSNENKEWGILDKNEKIIDKSDIWRLSKIPKIVHFYWGNKTLPYLRYLSILSFHKYNSDWKIILHVPSNPYDGILLDTISKFKFTGKDYFEELRKLPITIEEVDFSFLNNKCSNLNSSLYSRLEVFKSDYLRWLLLSTVGGLWSDMDIMYFKPMSDININIDGNKGIDTVISLHPEYGHSVGFMLSSPNNPYYNRILQTSHKVFNPNVYQSIGADLLNKDFPNVSTINTKFPNIKVVDIAIDTVYAYDALNILRIYNSDKMDRYTDGSIGLHWYAGYRLARNYINGLSHLNYKRCLNVLGKTIKKVYNEE